MSEPPADAARRAFIDSLRKLRRDCGDPSYAELRRLSQQRAGPGRRLPVLAESTTQEILAGKRVNLPDWPWVAAYAEACRAAAAQFGLDPARLGTIEDWHRAWSVAHDANLPGGTRAAQRPGIPADQDSSALAQPLPPPQQPPTPAEDELEYHAEFGPPDERSQTLNRYLRIYGRLGGRLLIAAEDGNTGAAYRLGVLLWCDGHRDEGLAWLEQAARAGIAEAAALCNSPSRTAAAEAAYNLGQVSDHGGDPGAALVYYQRAASCGNADAAYHAGAKFTDAGDPFTAGYWLDKAARLGHPDADRYFEDIYHRVRRGLNPPW